MDKYTNDNERGFIDTLPQGDSNGDWNPEDFDFTHIPYENEIEEYLKAHPNTPEARTIRQWSETKAYGVDTLRAMGYSVVYADARVVEALKAVNENTKRQGDVEHRQTDIERQFKDVIAKATKDSEVINARDSSFYGKFTVLRDRLENMEKIINNYIPSGFEVTIKHDLGRNVDVKVFGYDYGLGNVPLGTEPKGVWGGTIPTNVPAKLSYPDGNTVKVVMPLANKLNGTPVLCPEGNFRLYDGIHTLKFDFGGAVKSNPNLISD